MEVRVENRNDERVAAAEVRLQALRDAVERAVHYLRNPSRGVPPVRVANLLRDALRASHGGG